MTASEPRCGRTDLPESMCAHCRGHELRPDTSGAGPELVDGSEFTAEDFGPSFEARFRGRCAICGERTHEGAILAALTDGSGYACSRCVP